MEFLVNHCDFHCEVSYRYRKCEEKMIRIKNLTEFPFQSSNGAQGRPEGLEDDIRRGGDGTEDIDRSLGQGGSSQGRRPG